MTFDFLDWIFRARSLEFELVSVDIHTSVNESLRHAGEENISESWFDSPELQPVNLWSVYSWWQNPRLRVELRRGVCVCEMWSVLTSVRRDEKTQAGTGLYRPARRLASHRLVGETNYFLSVIHMSGPTRSTLQTLRRRAYVSAIWGT